MPMLVFASVVKLTFLDKESIKTKETKTWKKAFLCRFSRSASYIANKTNLNDIQLFTVLLSGANWLYLWYIKLFNKKYYINMLNKKKIIFCKNKQKKEKSWVSFFMWCLEKNISTYKKLIGIVLSYLRLFVL